MRGAGENYLLRTAGSSEEALPFLKRSRQHSQNTKKESGKEKRKLACNVTPFQMSPRRYRRHYSRIHDSVRFYRCVHKVKAPRRLGRNLLCICMCLAGSSRGSLACACRRNFFFSLFPAQSSPLGSSLLISISTLSGRVRFPSAFHAIPSAAPCTRAQPL